MEQFLKMKRDTINYRKLKIMEQVKTKVWKVKIKMPTEMPNNKRKENIKTFEWSFKLMLN